MDKTHSSNPNAINGRLAKLERSDIHKLNLKQAHEWPEALFWLIGQELISTQGPEGIESRFRGRVPDEWLLDLYQTVRNWAFEPETRLRVLELAGCIKMVDRKPVLQPGYSLVDNSPDEDPWGGSVAGIEDQDRSQARFKRFAEECPELWTTRSDGAVVPAG